jgi:hypothetical protein
VKRLDPVGLTFGEHYGDKERSTPRSSTPPERELPDPENVGEWFTQVVPPLSETS